jgi:hypothetical protein
MATLRDIQRRKEELLERYCAARLEEMLEGLRTEAAEHAEAERYPWKGEFRTREEVEYWYAERRRWDRRFLLDMTLVVLVLAGLCYGATFGVEAMMPMTPEGRR